jgi:hypothetical protein
VVTRRWLAPFGVTPPSGEVTGVVRLEVTASTSARLSGEFGSPATIEPTVSIYADLTPGGTIRTGKAYIYPECQISARPSVLLLGKATITPTATVLARPSVELSGLARGEYAIEGEATVIAKPSEVMAAASVILDQPQITAIPTLEVGSPFVVTPSVTVLARPAVEVDLAATITAGAVETAFGSEVERAAATIVGTVEVRARLTSKMRNRAVIEPTVSIIAAGTTSVVIDGKAAISCGAEIQVRGTVDLSVLATIETAPVETALGSAIEYGRSVSEEVANVLATLTAENRLRAVITAAPEIKAKGTAESAGSVGIIVAGATVVAKGSQLLAAKETIEASAAQMVALGMIEAGRATITAAATVAANGTLDPTGRAVITPTATVVAGGSCELADAATQSASATVNANLHVDTSVAGVVLPTSTVRAKGSILGRLFAQIEAQAVDTAWGSQVEHSPATVVCTAEVIAAGTVDSSSGQASVSAGATAKATGSVEAAGGTAVAASAFTLAKGTCIVVGRTGIVGTATVKADGSVGVTEWVWYYEFIAQTNPVLYPSTATYYLQVVMASAAGDAEGRLWCASAATGPPSWPVHPGDTGGDGGWLGNSLVCSYPQPTLLRLLLPGLPAGDYQYRLGVRKSGATARVESADILVRVS